MSMDMPQRNLGGVLGNALLSYTKISLRLLGAHLSKSQLYRLQAALNYLRLGRWMSDQGFHFERQLPDRRAVFDFMASRVNDKRVLYLEFGVYQGASILYWATKLRHPEAQLHGFDSFEGLPEAWGPWEKGRFETGGKIPVATDGRVKFFKGWFQDVLPNYVVPDHEVLIIVLDADLYSATSYVLGHLRPYIRQGTLIYFDEMNHVDHEPKAFRELMESSSLRFRPVCADRTLATTCFECIG